MAMQILVGLHDGSPCAFAKVANTKKDRAAPRGAFARCHLVRFDAARNGGRARSDERVSELNDHRTGARRRCRPMRCGHPSFRGAETSAADLGSELQPSSIALRWSTRKIPSLARRTRPHRGRAGRAELDIRGAFLTDETDRSAEPVPNRGGGAVVCVRYRAFEVKREWQRVCGW